MNMKKAAAGTAALLLCVSLSGCSSLNGASQNSAVKKVTTQKVTRGALTVGLVSDGKISLSLTDLNFAVSGTVKTINVAIGQTVTAGQVLATLDDTDYRQAVTTAQNELDQANSAYTTATQNHNINVLQEQLALSAAQTASSKNPNDSDLSTKLQIEQLKYNNLVNNDTSVSSARLKVNAAQNDLNSAQQNLSKAVLTAPSAGKINDIAYKVGEYVQSGSNSSSGGSGSNQSSSSAFMVLCDSSTINLTASVTEGDISGLAANQKLSVSVDALGLDNLMGKVTQVSNTAKTDSSGIVSYTVTGALDKPNSQIMDSMSCTVTFIKKQLNDVLMVPVNAVFTSDGKQYVNVKNAGGNTVKTAVSCGLSNGTQTQVLSGLSQGETVEISSIGSVTQP